MIRYAAILSASILVAASVGCSPPPPPMGGVAARIATGPLTATCGDGTAFLSHVKLLSAPYNPAPGGGAYQPPSGSAYSWPSSISDDLQNAFQNAPPFFQKHLCSLNGIYINASACTNNDPSTCNLTNAGAVFNGAWGFRSRAQRDLGFRYVAISAADLWPAGAPARALDNYETQVLQSFLPAGNGSAVSPSANPNKSWMSVLAALAHEAGHVVWAETTIPSVGKKYYFDGLINCAAGNFLVGWAYNQHGADHPHLQPKGRWRKFNNRDNDAGSKIDHSMPPSLDALVKPATASSALYQLYQANQPWASLFGAQTPDEDLVETYVMAVLTGYDPSSRTFAGPLTSLPLSIPGVTGSPADVPRDLVAGRKAGLANKMRCIPL